MKSMDVLACFVDQLTKSSQSLLHVCLLPFPVIYEIIYDVSFIRAVGAKNRQNTKTRDVCSPIHSVLQRRNKAISQLPITSISHHIIIYSYTRRH